MEFLKDYEFGLNYHLSKANVVIDALSRKSLHVSWMMVKKEIAELVNKCLVYQKVRLNTKSL